MATTPFIRDVPAAEAIAAWRAACVAARCPGRVDAVRMGLHEAVGRVTADPVWATRSSPSFDASAMDGIAVRAAETVGASESTPVLLDPGAYVVVDTGDPVPEGFDAVVVAGSSAGRDDHTAAIVDRLGTLAVHGVAVRPGHPVVLGAVDATPVLGAPGYPVSAALTFDIFAAPLLAALEGAAPPEHPRARARVARKLASSMGMDDWVRVRLGRVGGDLVATPLPRGAGVLTSLVRADGLLVVPAGLEGHHAGEHVDVLLLRGVGEIDRTIVAAGSHLLDPATGAYTLPYVDRVLAGRDVAVVRLVHREQGLIVAPGNPLGLNGIDDLARDGLRYVNRQRGAGTRVLLDHELATRGIAAEAIPGYAREEHTHLAVAAAIAAGRADAGLGVLAAARAFGLGFVPVTREPYDLVLATETLEDPVTAPLWALLDDPDFRAAVEALGGYATGEMGRRIR